MLSISLEDGDGNDVGESTGRYILRIPFGLHGKYL